MQMTQTAEETTKHESHASKGDLVSLKCPAGPSPPHVRSRAHAILAAGWGGAKIASPLLAPTFGVQASNYQALSLVPEDQSHDRLVCPGDGESRITHVKTVYPNSPCRGGGTVGYC